MEPDKEALFNEVYDTEHVPLLSQVPGVIAVRRLAREPCTLSIGGELKEIDAERHKKLKIFACGALKRTKMY